MTTEDLARAALPYVRHSLLASRPAIVERIGLAGMLAVWPAWAVVTGPLLPLLVRVGIELAVGLAAPNLLPVLVGLEQLLAALPAGYVPPDQRAWFSGLVKLLGTPRSQMLATVQATLERPREALTAEVGSGS